MKHAQVSPSGPSSSRSGAGLVLGSSLLLALAGCGGGNGGPLVSSGAAGAVVNHPQPELGSRNLVIDPNQSGAAHQLRLNATYWGRLAQVRDLQGVLQQSAFVIGEDIRSDNVDFRLDENPITEETTVTILHPSTPSTVVNGVETSPYQRAFRRLDQNLTPIADKSLAPDELPPYSLVPRNAAIVLQFNDLLDPDTINGADLKVFTGAPPTAPFEARIVADINHGGVLDRNGDGQGEFYTTRIIVDTTVSAIESALSPSPLPVNALGLPASNTVNQANVGIRIPTRTDSSVSQFTVLRTVSGTAVSFNGNGSNDPSSLTHDVVRAMRSGGATATTGDVNNGFLVDDIAPRVVGTLPIGISTPIPDGLGGFTCSLAFQYVPCRMPLKSGDVIQQPGVFAEITQPSNDADDGQLDGQFPVHARIIFPLDATLTAGSSQLTTLYDPVVNAAQGSCFVRFPTISQPPDQHVATDSGVIVRFSEPMDPGRLTPYDNFTITRVNSDPTARDFIIGSIVVSSDLKEFRFSPSLPLKHVTGSSEAYFVNLASGPDGPVDLAGTPLASQLPQVTFTLDPTQSTQNNAGIAIRFSSTDELTDNNGSGRREWRGQFLYDVLHGIVKPRAVVHFSAVADRNQPVPSRMTAFTPGVQTPLAALGSKLQTLWRYCDVGFGLLDEANFNVDAEGLAWSPIGSAAIADRYERFEMYLSHSKRLPDETVDMNLLPVFPNSGLEVTYANNVLDLANDPPRKVHDRSRGYTINPADLFTATTGTRMMPYPWNRGIDPAAKTFYTWRDTAVLAKGGLAGPGAELQVVVNTLGLPGPSGVPYQAGNVPTIGLPLLMEFRCFPDSGALGLNSFDISLSNLNSAQPNFRAFSTGGVGPGNVQVAKDPDLQPTATGGFNPGSTPPGQATQGVDNSFYIGEVELVTRISRAHSIWFDTGSGSLPQFNTPVIEPRPEDQPLGTQIVLAFRGSNSVTATGAQIANILNDSDALDPYGDPRPATPTSTPPYPGGGTVVFPNGDFTWKPSLGQVSGLRFFQVRVTFLSNAQTNLAPTLSALGFAYRL